jgi:outer membrane receptor protein involved in Fe transport
MRITLLAVALALFASVVPVSAQALIARYQLNIPRQPLDTALKDFAAQTGLQVARMSDAVDGSALVGPVHGDLSAEDALKSLLGPRGLSYTMVNDRTFAVFKPGVDTTLATTAGAGGAVAATEQGQSGAGQQAAKEKSSSDPFRLAQVDQGSTAGALAVEKKGQNRADKQSGALEEVIVTAQKREERLMDVPISLSVLTGQELDSTSHTEGMTEALNRIPGVTAIVSSQGVPEVVIRGVSPNVGTTTTAYYLDSVPFMLVEGPQVPEANVYDLERIEVLRGPQGTLYGASALNGVVRILTHDPDLNNFELKTRGIVSDTKDGGTNYDADLTVNAPLLPGKLAVRATAGYQDLSGWIDKPDQKDANDSVGKNFRAKIGAQPTEELSVLGSVWLSRTHLGAQSIGFADRTNATPNNQPVDMDYDLYGLKIGYQFPSFKLTATSGYIDYLNNSYFGLVDYGIPDALANNRFGSHVFSQEVILNSTNISSWRWTIGGMYRNGTDRTSSTWMNFPVPPSDFEYASESYALFGEVTRLFFDDRLELTGGIRYFQDRVTMHEIVSDTGDPTAPLQHAEDTFKPVTPRVVVTWHPTKEWMAYASYSEGFRSGFAQSPDTLRVVPTFPPVKPDRLKNYEVGAKGSAWDQRLSLEAAVYYIDWQDPQQGLTLSSPSNPIFFSANVNGGSISGFGTDLALAMQVFRGLQIGGTVSVNDLTYDSDVVSGGYLIYTKGSHLDASSKYTYGGWANYTCSLGAGLTAVFESSLNYMSRQSSGAIIDGVIGKYYSDPMRDVRASASIQGGNHWSATLFGDNLSDDKGSPTTYAHQAGPAADFAQRVRPRTIGLQLEYKF